MTRSFSDDVMHSRHFVSSPRTAIETPTVRINLGSIDIGLVVLGAIHVNCEHPRCVKFLIRDCSDVRVTLRAEWRAMVGEFKSEPGSSVEA